mmetsp:Transcript_29402/g.28546  ORF Transcript_29402/g.28546 Transcript_29402/m.28546 type:complete len:96 (+) Transcript_29402:1430-1717(+)
MVFKKCQIDGIKYGDIEKDEIDFDEGMAKSGIKKLKKRIKKEMKKDERGTYPAATEFFKLLALCNTVVCDYDDKTQKVKYSASSPDELALVEGAN